MAAAGVKRMCRAEVARGGGMRGVRGARNRQETACLGPGLPLSLPGSQRLTQIKDFASKRRESGPDGPPKGKGNLMAKAASKVTEATARETAGREIEEEIRALRADVAALARSVASYAGGAAEEIKEKGRAASEETVAEALKAVRELRMEVAGMQGELEGKVRANPLAWLAGAAGLGLLLGVLFGRRE